VLGGARSVREVQAETGRSVSTIHGHLLVLEKAGLVAWDRGRHRTLRPTVRAVK
jgi:predicted transcriptional regulator